MFFRCLTENNMDNKRFKQMLENAKEMIGIEDQIKDLLNNLCKLRARYQGLSYYSTLEYTDNLIRKRIEDKKAILFPDNKLVDIGMNEDDIDKMMSEISEDFQRSVPDAINIVTFKDVINVVEALTVEVMAWENL